MNAKLVIRTGNKISYKREFSPQESIAILCKTLSLCLNRKHYNNIIKVIINDNYYRINGVKIRIYYEGNYIEEYTFTGENLDEYYDS